MPPPPLTCRFVVACVVTLLMGVAVGALGAARRLVRMRGGGVAAAVGKRRSVGSLLMAAGEGEGAGRGGFGSSSREALLGAPGAGRGGFGGSGKEGRAMAVLGPEFRRKATIAALYCSQLTLGYLLMLVAMTYQV